MPHLPQLADCAAQLAAACLRRSALMYHLAYHLVAYHLACVALAACALIALPAVAAAQAPHAPPPPGGAAPGQHEGKLEGKLAEGKPPLVAGMIIKLPEGKPVTFEEMIRDLRHVRVVYLGETHDNMADHEGQLAVIKALQAEGRSVAIGMEMFQRPYQGVLDDWVAGKLDEKQLLNQTEWYDRWSMDFSYYQPILVHAREAGKKLLALNAPEELVHEVGRNGLSGLSPEQRAKLPNIYLGRAEHRHYIEHIYQAQAGVGHHQNNFEHFYEAQRVWDETMAQSVAMYVVQPGAAQIVAVIAGNGHVEYGLGMPGDVVGRVGAPYRIISFQEEGHVTWEPGPGPPTPLFDYGHPLANYVWITTESKEQDKPKLGIGVGKPPEGQTGVAVEDVMEGSPAAKANLKAGDVIVAFDSEAVGSLADLRYALSHKQFGDKVRIEVVRGGKKESATVTLSPLPKERPAMKMKKGHPPVGAAPSGR